MRLVVFSLLIMAAAIPASAQNSEDAKQSGIDKELFSDTVAMGDNFYRYANDKWLTETQIPGDKSNYGIFTVLADDTREQVRTLIEAAAMTKAAQGSPTQKVGDLYSSVLDLEARNAAGLGPIRPLLEMIQAVDSPTSLGEAVGTLRRAGIGAPVVPYVSVDAKNSEAYTVYLTQSGISLPDRDYYLQDEERYVELRKKLKVYIADMLKVAGHTNPESAAEGIFEIESKIAEAHWTKTESRDPVATYNPRTHAELDEMLGGIKWFDYAAVAGIDSTETVVVRQPSFVEAFGDFAGDFTMEQWKDYFTYHTVDGYATSLSETLERRHFDFHDADISGITEQQPMWQRGVDTTGSVLGELVGQVYVEKHFVPVAKQRMNELVQNLTKAFGERIKTRDWMGEGTKKQALEKLSKFTTKIGYPDKWKSYDKLTIGDGVLADHLLASAEFEYQRNLDKLGEPIDRDEWHMTPQTVNAYYNPTMNEIVFPAAILQPPFFNLEADDAANYGGIGAVIGHEISHGFDDKGSKFDGNGNLRMWWTEEDRTEFEARAKGLVAQYNAFEPIEGQHVNGELTLGENIGDLGGLNVAYAAYRLSLNGKEAKEIDGLTGDQRFFLNWAQIWRRKYREAELVRRLNVDPHSPSEYRANGIVRNMKAWYEAFGIKPESEMYLAPKDRVKIW